LALLGRGGDNPGSLLRNTNNWKNLRNNWNIDEYVTIPLRFPFFSNFFKLFPIILSVFQFSNYLALLGWGGAQIVQNNWKIGKRKGKLEIIGNNWKKLENSKES